MPCHHTKPASVIAPVPVGAGSVGIGPNACATDVGTPTDLAHGGLRRDMPTRRLLQMKGSAIISSRQIQAVVGQASCVSTQHLIVFSRPVPPRRQLLHSASPPHRCLCRGHCMGSIIIHMVDMRHMVAGQCLFQHRPLRRPAHGHKGHVVFAVPVIGRRRNPV